MVPCLRLSRPYASDAAVGSLTMRRTSRPAIRPASLVAWRCSSLKYAGTVMTAFLISSPKAVSALRFFTKDECGKLRWRVVAAENVQADDMFAFGCHLE